MRLFIAEKPSVARAIAAELGTASPQGSSIVCGSDTVTWCFGHMLEQAEPDDYTPDGVPRTPKGRKIWRTDELPIIPESWKLHPKPKTKKQLTAIGRLLKRADVVVNAGDPDREGQLLVDDVLEHFGNRKPVHRFWVSAQDPISIQRGLRNLRDNADYAGMADAARARQRADWLVGMNLSRAYTLRAERGGTRALLTVGRVQTPTLALVVTRDREIERFVSKPYYLVKAALEHEAGSFVATYKPGDDAPGLDSDGRLVDRERADELAAAITGKTAEVTEYKAAKKKQAPPTAFSLSDLTVLASRKYGYGAEQTLQACQSLYEVHKIVSYPRTDCGYLPESQHADAAEVLVAVRRNLACLGTLVEQADDTRKSPTWNDKKVTAHHGIIPTMQVARVEDLSGPERNLYELIARRYVAQFLPDHEYLKTDVRLLLENLAFTATGKVVTVVGWKQAEQAHHEDEASPDAPEGEGDQPLPPMAKGDPALCAQGLRKDAKTKPPPKFSEGSLIRAMEQVHKYVHDPAHKKLLREGDGIGTSATRATIVSELKRRGFLAASGKHIVSTALGRALVDELPEAVKSAALTALYERMLRDVEQGSTGLQQFVALQEGFVRERVEEAGQGATTLQLAAQRPAQPRTRKGGSRRRKAKKRVPKT